MIGTRYAIAVVRFLVDFSNKEDVRQVHALQDAIKFSQERPGAFEIPHWDEASLKKRLFVKSCGRILTQNEGESPVDSGFVRIRRRSEFACESGMLLAGKGWRRREVGPGHFNKAAAFA